MSPEEIHKIRKEIGNRIMEAEKTIETLREQTAPVPPSVAIGRLTRMDAIQQKNMAESNLKSSESMIIQLKKALERIDDPDFGVCVSCKNNIPAERMIAVPETRLCVKCVPPAGRR